MGLVAMKIIFLIMVVLSVSWTSEIKIDSNTGLVWQDNTEVISIKLNWEEAKEYCEVLDLENYSDWRLPSIRELKSIVAVNRIPPEITKRFKYFAYLHYWSSSKVTYNETEALSLKSTRDYREQYTDKTYALNVRCVRGTQKCSVPWGCN